MKSGHSLSPLALMAWRRRQGFFHKGNHVGFGFVLIAFRIFFR